jgi:hypothetical protein
METANRIHGKVGAQTGLLSLPVGIRATTPFRHDTIEIGTDQGTSWWATACRRLYNLVSNSRS